MKVLTAAEMREVDRRTIELGIPGIVLMENAAHRVMEVIAHRYAPLNGHRIVVFCGRGNNGGDGLAIARQLFTRYHPASLDILLAARPEDLQGDAAENLKMLRAAGADVAFEITPDMRRATLVIDALLGTGLNSPARGLAAEWIHQINTSFAAAKVVAVDLPSGLQSDSANVVGEAVRAHSTVTFTAPKPCHVLSPACEWVGQLSVGQIGSPTHLFEQNPAILFHLSEPARFRHLFKRRVADSNKGLYGHVLVVAGGRGKTGAAAMAGTAALRAGAGLVTVASAESAIGPIAAHAPELMTEPLPETSAGMIARLTPEALQRKTLVAIGPGLGSDPETVKLIRATYADLELPMVVDADALNALANDVPAAKGPRVLTPHPGEMGRLTNKKTDEVQAHRVALARAFAKDHAVCLVLKGNRTAIAFPDGNVWINPTGSPAMATGGTGDILTGMLAGLIAQFPDDLEAAVLAGVWMHGRAGELGAKELGEKSLIATDLLRYLPEAIREVASLSD